jgi:hypothetical protein
VPGLDRDIDDVIDTPAQIASVAEGTLDGQLVAIIQCAEELAAYVEELHAPHGFDQLLAADGFAEVAQCIDGLGQNRHGQKGSLRPEVAWSCGTAIPKRAGTPQPPERQCVKAGIAWTTLISLTTHVSASHCSKLSLTIWMPSRKHRLP